MEEKSKRSRKLREWYPNAMYHITSRGNRRNDIFRDNEDYEVYITILKEAIEFLDNQYEIICYCLMTNHVHLQLLATSIASSFRSTLEYAKQGRKR